jgi:pimeloyl-ACP methyl ester carboxylesterase
MVSSHLLTGQFTPVFEGVSSWNIFVKQLGFETQEKNTQVVLFLHALPGSSLSFAQLQTDLAAREIASIALDLPGFGLSDKKSETKYSVSFFAEILGNVLAALHLDSVHLVAEGNACNIAAKFAEKKPHLINSVYLMENCHPFPTVPPNKFAFWFEFSPALPALLHRLIYGTFRDSMEIAASNRWLTMLVLFSFFSLFLFLFHLGTKTDRKVISIRFEIRMGDEI